LISLFAYIGVLHISYNFINSQTCDVVFSLFFEKSRQRHSGVVKFSTGAVANSFKTAVAPTHD